jgi:MoxR-like ATPase
MRGRAYVLPQDIFDVAPDVLRHRVLLSYEALAEGTDAEEIVTRVLSTVLAPRVAPSQDGLTVEAAS